MILQHQPKYPLFNTDRRTHKGDRVETGMGVRVLGFLRVWENLDFEENGREELWELMEKEGNKGRETILGYLKRCGMVIEYFLI